NGGIYLGCVLLFKKRPCIFATNDYLEMSRGGIVVSNLLSPPNGKNTASGIGLSNVLELPNCWLCVL
ncbi:MAG: hypothetical protein RR696_14825, partial [Clostridia bacterium]